MATPVEQKQLAGAPRYDPKNGAPIMPPVEYGDWLIHHLWAIGPIARDGAPVSWQEINAWERATDRKLGRWESETLHAMSEAYAIWAIKARKQDCKAPWKPVELAPAIVNSKIMSVFGAMHRKKPETGAKPLAQKIPKN